MLSRFLCDVSKSNFTDPLNNGESILSVIRRKFPTLFNLNASISYNGIDYIIYFYFLFKVDFLHFIYFCIVVQLLVNILLN